ncbi:protein Mmf1p, mitochondrial [Diutina catenulata]
MSATILSWDKINGKEHPTLRPAAIHNGVVYTSGIIGQHYDNGVIPESLDEQTELAIANVKSILEASGSSLDKVFKVTMWISHANYAKVVQDIYGKHFPQKPARSCTIAAFMDPAIKYEIEVIASQD